MELQNGRSIKTRVIRDVALANIIADIHRQTFTKFFLTFLGKGFLRELYKGFITHDKSDVIAAFENNEIIGFVAYSQNIGVFYKYLIRKSLIPFAWYSFLAFLRKPGIMFRLLRAFTYSDNNKRDEEYIELSSIGVLPGAANKGVGTTLIGELKSLFMGSNFSYIKLETDKLNNDAANAFYIKNEFELNNSYITREGREMNEYCYNLVEKETPVILKNIAIDK